MIGEKQVRLFDKAKTLYSLALYAMGDQAAAEKITAEAFADVLNSVLNGSDERLFKEQSIKSLYRFGRMSQKKIHYDAEHLIPAEKSR